MDVKSRVITKIDDLLVEYNEGKNSGPVTRNTVKRHNAIEGAISALGFLKRQIQDLDPVGFASIGIVETSKKELRTLGKPKGFLSRVLFSIEDAREHIRLNLRIGDGPLPDAVQGRNEACDLMDKFVWQLNAEITDNQ